MLLINGEQFNPTANNPDHAIQKAHYEESVKMIRETYGRGGRNSVLTLTRRKEPKRNATGELEDVPPIVFPAKAYVEIQFASKDHKRSESLAGMETWAYSENRPNRDGKNDLWEPDPKSIKFMSQSQVFDMNSEMELIYFLLYKSPRVYHLPAIAQGKAKKGDLIVEDKALKAREKVETERNALKLKNAIMAPSSTFPLYSDENLRKVAAAWGIEGAMDQHESVDNLRLILEHRVKEGEKEKKQTGEGKGFDEFFALIDFDDSVRQRAIIMYALDSGKVKHDREKGVFTFASGGLLLEVPASKKYVAFDYLADHLAKPLNDKEWDLFVKEVIDEDYIHGLTYDDLKWLARHNDITISKKKAEDLKEDLISVYCG